MAKKLNPKDPIRLVKVSAKNFNDLIGLTVRQAQKNFVADNIYSLAEAYATQADSKPVQPFGIYKGEKPVGFLMIGFDYDNWDDELPGFSKNGYLIWRFMIDKRYQGRGYGREARKLALDYVRTFPFGRSEYCWVSYEPENEVAKNLYLSFGFEEAPEYYKEGDEMPAVLKL